MKLRLKIYLAIIYITFFVTLFYMWEGFDLKQTITMIGLMMMIYIFNLDVVRDLQSGISYTIVLPFVIPGIVYLSPAYAMLFVFTSEFLIYHKKEWYKRLYNGSKDAFSILLASVFFHQIFSIVNVTILFTPEFFVILFLAAFIYTVTNILLLLTVITLEKGTFDVNSFISIISITKSAFLTVFLGLINTILFYYTNLVGVAIFTFLIYFIKPALQYRFIFDNELSTYTKFILHILKQMDPITHTHSERVKYWTVLMAKKMELPQSEIRQLSQAASWHDVGKIEIPLEIIDKPGKLTAEEYELMKTHPEKGYQLVKDMHFFKKFLPVIRHHHERVDGNGYPLGLKGEEIPLHARIMAITDAFDAMTSDRSYREGMTMEEAVDELRNYAGTQFDQRLIEIFIEALKDEYGENYERFNKEILANVS